MCELFFCDKSLVALHSFSFTQKIKDHSSLLSVGSIYKSDVPSSEVYMYNMCTEGAEDRGHQTDTHLPQSPFTGKFFLKTTFSFGVNQKVYIVN